MFGLKVRMLVSAAIAGSMILVGVSAASAHDDRHDDRHDERWERDHHRDWDHRYHGPDHWRPAIHPVREVYVEPPPRIVYQRPPVMVMPAPVYQAPAYQAPVDPSLNFNFTIPLR